MIGEGYMTDAEFAEKLDNEGGLYSALQYGLRTDDLVDQHGELALAFAKVERGFLALQPDADELDKVLDKIDRSEFDW